MVRVFTRRLALFYAVYFMATGLYLPFYPVWLAARGMDEASIALILAAPLFARVIAGPLFGFWADQARDRRHPIRLFSLMTVSVFSFLGFGETFLALLLLTLFGALFAYSILPLADAFTMSGARALQADYGRIRLWGSLAFIGANFVGGYALDLWGVAQFHVMLIGVYGALLVVSFLLPDVRHLAADKPEHAMTDGGCAPEKAGFLPFMRRYPSLLLLMLAGAVLQASHVVYYGFSSLIWQSHGMTTTTIGLLSGFGVLAEIGFFFVSKTWSKRLSIETLFLIGATGSMIRWIGLSLDPTGFLLWPLQALHALSFAFVHFATVSVISARLPDRRTAYGQSLYFTINGILMASAMYLSGLTVPSYQAGAYLFMAGASFTGLLIVLVVRQIDGQRNQYAM